jgi:hypothetical protein
MFDGCGEFFFGLVLAIAAIWFVFFVPVGATTADSNVAMYLITGAGNFMEAALVFGSLGFWAFIVILISATMALAENSRVFWAGAVLVAGGFALQKYSGLAILPYIFQNPWVVVFIALGYFAIGTGWSIIKWYLFLKKTRRIYDNVYKELSESKRFKDKPPEPGERPEGDTNTGEYGKWHRAYNAYAQYMSDFKDSLNERLHREIGFDFQDQVRPKVGNFKTKIVGWILYWPTSIVWTFAADSIHHLTTFAIDIYGKIANYLQKMSDDIWKGTEIK